MFGFMKQKQERNYQVVKSALDAASIDSSEKVRHVIKTTFKNGVMGSIIALAIFSGLMTYFPETRQVFLAFGIVVFAWIWGSVFRGRKHVLRYKNEEVIGKQSSSPSVDESSEHKLVAETVENANN